MDSVRKISRPVSLLILLSIVLVISNGCVDQKSAANTVDTISKSTAKVDNTKEWPQTDKRIVVTSMATVFLMEKLQVDLVGIPTSDVDEIPDAYKNATRIGSAMNPDMEIIRSLEPSYVFSPVSLAADLKPKYDQANLEYGFINLNNVPGMYKSIEDLGKLLNREKEASLLVREYQDYIETYQSRNKEKEKKKILILMGLPGSYVVATEHSYVGSLVKLAGGVNIYSDEQNRPFLNVNIEDMLKREPDIILRTAHALPEDVKEMFSKEFKENNNWKHFKAVQENKVFDLEHTKFGMSAKFNYPEALEDLEEILYAS